jgi:hypothetical protein
MSTLRVLASLALALMLSGCWSDPLKPSVAPSSAPALTSPPSQEPFPLLSIETRGGLCTNGPCSRLVNIEADGQIHEVIPKDRIVGTIPQPLLDALQVEMAKANFALLQGRKFTGQCPTAFDGQETIYTFHVPSGDEEIATCKVAIDENHPLFRAVAAARTFETP